MQEIVYMLMLLSVLSFWIHISLLTQKGLWALPGVLLAVFAYQFYPVAIRQNSPAVSAYLHDPAVAQGLIFLIAEGMLLLTAGLLQLRQFHDEPVRKSQQYAFYFPGPSVLAAIALSETQLFFQGIDMSFTALALCVATGVFVLFSAMPVLIKRLLPEKDLRLELKIVLHFLQIITACLLTAGFDFPAPDRQSGIPDLKPLAFTLLVALMLGALGYLSHLIKKKKWKY